MESVTEKSSGLIFSQDGADFQQPPLAVLDAPVPDLNGLPVLMGYSKHLFTERMRHAIQTTAGYDGQLEATWQKSQSGELYSAFDPFDAGTLPALERHQQEQIGIAVQRVKNTGARSVAIEAAHVYCYDSLDDPDLCESIVLQARFAAHLAHSLEENGISARQILFIDDYNPNPASSDAADQQRLDIDQFIALTESAGYRPGMILREGDMVSLAESMISAMDAQGLVVHDTGSDEREVLYLNRGRVELYRGEDNMVSCAMLDAALTLVKLSYLGEGVINILPRRPENNEFSYKSQQRKMRNIVGEHLNARALPIINLFVGQGSMEQVAVAAGAHNVLRKPARD